MCADTNGEDAGGTKTLLKHIWISRIIKRLSNDIILFIGQYATSQTRQ